MSAHGTAAFGDRGARRRGTGPVRCWGRRIRDELRHGRRRGRRFVPDRAGLTMTGPLDGSSSGGALDAAEQRSRSGVAACRSGGLAVAEHRIRLGCSRTDRASRRGPSRVVAGSERRILRRRPRALPGMACRCQREQRGVGRAARDGGRRLYDGAGDHADDARADHQPRRERCADGHQLPRHQPDSDRAERSRLRPDVDPGGDLHGHLRGGIGCGTGGGAHYRARAVPAAAGCRRSG